MIPIHQRAFVFRAVENVQMLRPIAWYRPSCDCLVVLFPNSQPSTVAERALACARGAIGQAFFTAEKEEIMHRAFAVLKG